MHYTDSVEFVCCARWRRRWTVSRLECSSMSCWCLRFHTKAAHHSQAATSTSVAMCWVAVDLLLLPRLATVFTSRHLVTS